MRTPVVVLAEESGIADRLGNAVEVRREVGLTPADLAAAVADADALVVRNQTQVTEELLRAAKRLRVVGRLGAGLENVDVAAARELAMEVVYAPDANTAAVAEFCLGEVFNLSRLLPWAHESVREGHWQRQRFTGREMSELTIGVVGFGRIGRLFSELLVGLGATVVVSTSRPHLVPDTLRCLPFGELLAASDIVSLHVPATAATRHLVDDAALRTMRPHAALINTSRGSVVDETALHAALTEGRLAYAALDVRAGEPPAAGGLAALPNVLATPHIAAFTQAAQRRVDDDVAAGVLAVLAGERPAFPAP